MTDYLLHKFLDLIVKPSNWLLLAAVIGVCGGLLLRRFWIIWFGAVFLVAMFLLSFLPFGEWLIVPLENRYGQAERYPERVDGVVAIGSRINKSISEARNAPAINGEGQPFLALVEFAQHFPDAELILTGIGESTDSYPADLSSYVRQYYRRVGFDPDRITYEPHSLTMEEFAVNTLDLAKPEPDEVWYLSASAYRMPRAMAVFEAAGWDIRPWPTDFRTNGDYEPIAPHLRPTYYLFLLDFSLNEWLGLAELWWQGKTDSIWGPLQQTTAETNS